MTLDLKPEQERIIAQEIRKGHFHSAGEVIDYALAAMQEKERSVVGIRTFPLKNLAEVLTMPAFAGSELNLDRQSDTPRPLDL